MDPQKAVIIFEVVAIVFAVISIVVIVAFWELYERVKELESGWNKHQTILSSTPYHYFTRESGLHMIDRVEQLEKIERERAAREKCEKCGKFLGTTNHTTI